MYALQKIRTSFKEGNGLNDYYISPELKEQQFQELNKKINILGTHYHNQKVLGLTPSEEDIQRLAPVRFVYFTQANFAIFVQSRYIGLDYSERYNNHLSHSVILKNKNKLYNPLKYLFSASMCTNIPKTREDFYAEDISWEIFKKNTKEINTSVKKDISNERLEKILALLIESKIDSKPLILLGSETECIHTLTQLFSLLPQWLIKNISFSTLAFFKLDKKHLLLDINYYTSYSLGLGHIPSYNNFEEIINDAKMLSFNYINLNEKSLTINSKHEKISAYLTQPKNTLIQFYEFCTLFTYSFEDLPFMIKLYGYTQSKNIPKRELFNIIDFYFKHALQENNFDFINANVDFNMIKNDTELFIKIFSFMYPKIYKNISLSLKVEDAMLKNTLYTVNYNNNTTNDLREKITLIKETIGVQKLITYFLNHFDDIYFLMKSTDLKILLVLDEILLPLMKKYFKVLPRNYFTAIANKIQNEPKLIAQRLRFYNSLDFHYILAFFNALSINETVFIKAITEKKDNLESFINNFILHKMYEPVMKIYLYQMSHSNDSILNILNYKESSKYILFKEFQIRVCDEKSIDKFTTTCLEKFKNDGKFLNALLHDKYLSHKDEIMASVNNFLRLNCNNQKKYIKVPVTYSNTSEYKLLTLLNIEQQIDRNDSTNFDTIIKDIDKLKDLRLQQQLMQKVELKKNPVTFFDRFKSIYNQEKK